ncbi:MAG: LCP family protein [Flaviflexus sp.]|nr:LCP family protein [Flaviflexus sp.]
MKLFVLALIIFLIGWPIYLFNYGSSQLTHVAALSGAPDTPGRTVLFAGTDKRSEEGVNDGVEGARSDSIMLVHVPTSGTPSLISLPRDTYVQIPGRGAGKLNSSYAAGGPKLLVATVENLTGLTIDHYVEVGMDGISHLVDAVGGVELCLDYDVTQDLSGLEWKAGCHRTDGPTALAFSRMRYSDPLGDIGRTARQRQVISQIVNEAKSPATLLNPLRQRAMVGDGARQLTVDENTAMTDLAKIALSMRKILGPNGVVGTPPIAMLNYQPGGVGSTVLLDEAKAPEFFRKVADGSISQADVEVSLP